MGDWLLALGGLSSDDSTAGEESEPVTPAQPGGPRGRRPERCAEDGGSAEGHSSGAESSAQRSEGTAGAERLAGGPAVQGRLSVRAAQSAPEDSSLAVHSGEAFTAALRGHGASELTELRHRSATVSDLDLDQSSFAIGSYLLDEKVHVASGAAEADKLGVSRSEFRTTRDLAAALSRRFQRECWAQIEASFAHHLTSPGSQADGLVYIEWSMYDGVDLKVETTTLPSAGSVAQGGEGGPGPGYSDPAANTASCTTETGTAKLLNAEAGVAMLFEFGGETCVVEHTGLSCLQALNRTTAECLRSAAQSLCQPGEVAALFRRRVRVAMTDGAAYNKKCERHMVSERDGWQTIHILCNIHIVAGIYRKTFGLMQSFVDNMVVYSLSLRPTGQMAAFRRAFRRVIERDMVLTTSPPGPEALRFRDLVLETFCGGAEHTALKLALVRCCSGDWRRRGVIEVYAPDGEDRRAMLAMLEGFLMPALAGHCPRTFPVSRWTGLDDALLDAGLFSCVHGLAETVYAEFMRINLPFDGAMREETGPMLGPAPILDEGMRDLRFGAGDGPNQAALNRAYRGRAFAWLSARPARELIIARKVLSPMMGYLKAELELAGGLAAAQRCRVTPGASDGGRFQAALIREARFPIVVAASCSLDDKCLGEISDLHRPERYEGFQVSWSTVETRSLIFRLLSREAACIYELCKVEHLRFPTRLFTLLCDEGAANDILRSCPSSMDAYTASFVSAYGPDLRQPSALSELLSIATIARTSTSRLEALNATIRRRLLSISLQCRIPALKVLSSEVLLGKFRRQQHEVLNPPGSATHWKSVRKHAMKPTGHRRGGGQQSVRKRGGGGPWRAFCSEARGGKRPDWRELGRQYNALTPEARLKYESMGKLGTLARAYGGSAFGDNSKRLRLALDRASVDQRCRELEASALAIFDDGARCLSLAPGALGAATKQAKRDVRLARRAKVEGQRAVADNIVDWVQGGGMQRRDKLALSVKSLAKDIPGFYNMPSHFFDNVFRWVCPNASVVPRMLGLQKSSAHAPFFEKLAVEWSGLHNVVEHNEQPKLPGEEPSRSQAKPSCLLAGMCLCGVAGDAIWKMKLGVLRAMRSAMQSPALRQDLCDGRIVLRFMCAEREQSLSTGVLEEELHGLDKFVHVSLMYFSPYRPTFRALASEDPFPDEFGLLELQASDKYLTVVELSKELVEESTGRVSMSLHRVHESARPVPLLDARRVEVQAVHGVTEQSVGCQSKRPKPTKAPTPEVRPDEGWLDALDNMSCDDSAMSSDDLSEALGEILAEQLGGLREFREDSDGAGSEAGGLVEEDGVATQTGDGATTTEAGASSTQAPALLSVPEEVADIGIRIDGSSGSSSSSSTSSSSSSSSGSGSGSQGIEQEDQDAPPPPPPAVPDQPAPQGARPSGRSKCHVQVEVPGGVLRVYLTKAPFMVAHCMRHGEQKCRLTRSLTGLGRRGREGQGRPAGLQAAWLSEAENYATAYDHIHMTPLPGFSARELARSDLMGIDGIERIFECERPQRPGEGIEPEMVP